MRASVSVHAGLAVAARTRAASAAASVSLTPGGATTARQLARSSGTPASRSVGASSPGTRVGDEIASARSCPALMLGANSPRPLTPAVTWPPSSAASASPPPENAT